MNRHIISRIAVILVMLGVGAGSVAAQPTPLRHNVPPVPPLLQVEAGHQVFLAASAQGTQNYICLPSSTGVAWRFIGPQATLFRTVDGEPFQQITTHYLSVNPVEVNVFRPTWQHSSDSSRVWGRVRQASNDSNFVEPGAIDWLLLEVAGVDEGILGGGVLAQTTFIQRLNTSGGVMPQTGCSSVSQIGTLALVPYSTDYFFYRASRAR